MGINFLFLNGNVDLHWWLFLLFPAWYVTVRIVSEQPRLRQLLLNVTLVIVLVEAIWGMLQLYGITRSYHNIFPIIGSLFNPGPYSGFLIIGIPLALGWILSVKISLWERILGAVTLIAAGLVLPATMSRAAWLAVVSGCFPVAYYSFRRRSYGIKGSKLYRWLQQKGHWNLIIPMVVIIALSSAAGLYLIKRNSADGRLFLWRVCMNMIEEHPLSGSGYGSFAAVYGPAQADYFSSGKGNEKQEMVADSPEYAFNEFIQVAVELGLTGVLLFFMIIISIFRRPDDKTETSGEDAGLLFKASLLALLTFSAFSYPFTVLPLSIMFVFVLALAASFSKPVMASRWLYLFILPLCAGCTFYGSGQVLSKYDIYKKWRTVQTRYNSGRHKEIMEDYRKLYPIMNHNKQFLYEHARNLAITGEYAESNRIFEQYLLYGSDPMAYNCMGNNYKGLKQYALAASFYQKAAATVPNRYHPLSLLLRLYQETGEIEKMIETAGLIRTKPAKVPSKGIDNIKHEAGQIILKKDSLLLNTPGWQE
jgi:O-antigen ligase